MYNAKLNKKSICELLCLKRLTIEAELADNANSRIRALELLGKTVKCLIVKKKKIFKCQEVQKTILEELKIN